MNKSSKKTEYSDISSRVLELAQHFKKHKGMSNKEFLEMCEVNKSLIYSIKSKQIQNPNSEIIQRIVKKTGCSGTWILGGDAEMFEPRRNQEISIAADPEVEYAVNLIESIEQRKDALKGEEPPPDIEIRLTRALLAVLERRQAG